VCLFLSSPRLLPKSILLLLAAMARNSGGWKNTRIRHGGAYCLRQSGWLEGHRSIAFSFYNSIASINSSWTITHYTHILIECHSCQALSVWKSMNCVWKDAKELDASKWGSLEVGVGGGVWSGGPRTLLIINLQSSSPFVHRRELASFMWGIAAECCRRWKRLKKTRGFRLLSYRLFLDDRTWSPRPSPSLKPKPSPL
jgi:hypothetical protein